MLMIIPFDEIKQNSEKKDNRDIGHLIWSGSMYVLSFVHRQRQTTFNKCKNIHSLF